MQSDATLASRMAAPAELGHDLDADLCALLERRDSAGLLPDPLGPAGLLAGPVVVQLAALVDVSRPASAAPQSDGGGGSPFRAGRTLLLTLTDGRTECKALELCPLPQLTPELCVPGTKLALRGVPMRKGLLLLSPGCTRVLGGRVPALLEELAAREEQDAMGATRLGKDGAGGAPPFVDLDSVEPEAAAPAAGGGATARQPPQQPPRGSPQQQRSNDGCFRGDRPAANRDLPPQQQPEPEPEPEPEVDGEWNDWLAEQREMEKNLLRMQHEDEADDDGGGSTPFPQALDGGANGGRPDRSIDRALALARAEGVAAAPGGGGRGSRGGGDRARGRGAGGRGGGRVVQADGAGPVAAREGLRLSGVARRWNDRGFGFIRPSADGDIRSGEDLFCHVSSIRDGNCVRNALLLACNPSAFQLSALFLGLSPESTSSLPLSADTSDSVLGCARS